MSKPLADIVICWYADSPGVQAALGLLTGPVRFIGMKAGPGTSYRDLRKEFGETAIQGICKKFASDVTPQRVALLGFSEGCGGVREALRSGDGPRVDAAFAIDGIHATWIDEKTKAKFDTSDLVVWKAYAKAATEDGRLCVITTSSIVPPFVSTTITSDWIWSEVTGSSAASYDAEAPEGIWDGPVLPPYTNPAGSQIDKATGKPAYSWPERVYTRHETRLFRKKNGLSIWNYKNIDPSGIGDHRFQAARVAPLMLAAYLAPRWNGITTGAGAGITLV